MKICFIIPHLSNKASNNYHHQLELAAKLSSDTDIFIFGETADHNFQSSNNFYVQKLHLLPFRLIERFLVICYLRFRGYKKFYNHYSIATSLITATVARLSRAQSYLWFCSKQHHYLRNWSPSNLKQKILTDLPILISWRLNTHLVTCSSEMKKYFVSKFHLKKNKVIVIPNHVCLKHFSTTTTKKSQLKQQLDLPNKPILLFVHRLAKRKGADRLIEYAQIIKKKKLNLHIIAIGSGPLFNQLQSQIKNQKLTAQITLRGPIPNQKLPNYYQASDIFIMPSRIEEFGRVQLEAMATGLPIVATQTLATDTLLNKQQNKYVLKQSQHKHIPQVSMQIINDSKKYQQLKSAGLKIVTQYSLSEISQQYKQKIIKT